jgi:pimeloyl-ACP methyl ester carboxylesterase
MVVFGDRDIIKLEHSLEMYRLMNKGQFCILPYITHNVFSERHAPIDKIAIDFFF